MKLQTGQLIYCDTRNWFPAVAAKHGNFFRLASEIQDNSIVAVFKSLQSEENVIICIHKTRPISQRISTTPLKNHIRGNVC